VCGICGIARPGKALTHADLASVGAMVSALCHRGPDGNGVWNDGDVAFGHARLSIIDIAGGHQPMFNETRSIAVTFNGEIYNYRDLRDRLIALGHVFVTRSDTEVLVHGYEEWGDAVVEHLRGMFAFAIWDRERHRLLLGRDRAGEKPLYFSRLPGGELIFASEIKAVAAHPDAPRAFDDSSLAEYLTFRSISGTRTLFRGIEEVPPASLMVVDPSGERTRSYWTPDVEVMERPFRPALVEEGRALLIEAVRLRLMSDVGLGTITSGGLDSSLVSAITSELTGKPLDTFCVGFDDPAFDERPFARAMSDHMGARFHELVVSASDIDRELDALTWAHDEPLTHPNSIPMHLLFRFAKEKVGITVLLSGEGADELFGGYDWYRVAAQRSRLRALAPFRGLVPSLSPRLSALRRVLAPDFLLVANAVTRPAVVGSLGAGGDALGARRSSWSRERGDLDALFVYDQRTYLPPLLQRQDRMSMAAGVEARVVFLDHPLVQWANSISASVKLPGGERKGLLKRIADRWVPREIVERRKVGFTLPLGTWLRPGGALAHRLDALRETGGFVRSRLDPRRLDEVLGEHARGTADHADLLWSLIALEAWAAQFLAPKLVFKPLPGAFSSLVSRASEESPPLPSGVRSS
jgi:asparagine synthase (glutamine-hydrolysing)